MKSQIRPKRDKSQQGRRSTNAHLDSDRPPPPFSSPVFGDARLASYNSSISGGGGSSSSSSSSSGMHVGPARPLLLLTTAAQAGGGAGGLCRTGTWWTCGSSRTRNAKQKSGIKSRWGFSRTLKGGQHAALLAMTSGRRRPTRARA